MSTIVNYLDATGKIAFELVVDNADGSNTTQVQYIDVAGNMSEALTRTLLTFLATTSPILNSIIFLKAPRSKWAISLSPLTQT
jgi:hypothetical protein